MKNVIITLLALLSTWSCSVSTQSLATNNPTSKLTAKAEPLNTKEWIQAKIDSTLQANNIPALSIGVVSGGEIFMQKGFGEMERASKDSVNENSIYQIGSLSKMFTGIVANNLIKEGQLDLEAPIVKYLPNVIPSEAEGGLKPKIIKRLEKVKVRNLLHHNSGIRRTPKMVDRIDGDPMLGGYTEEDLFQELNQLKLKFTPGAKFQYSNLGYGILGAICESVSGENYEALLEKYVGEKYQMNNTFTIANEEQQASIVTPYRKDKRNVKTQAWEMGKLAPGGGVYSNTSDLTTLIKLQLAAYQQYKKYEKPNRLIITESTYALNDKGTNYGFGLFQHVGKETSTYEHGGDLDGFGTVYIFLPEEGLGIILMTSSGGKWLPKLGNEIFVKMRAEFKNQSA